MQNILVHTANADTSQIYMYEKNLYYLEGLFTPSESGSGSQSENFL